MQGFIAFMLSLMISVSPYNETIKTTSGKFTRASQMGDKTYYVFCSEDGALTWFLTADELGFSPDFEESCILYYSNNGTDKCECGGKPDCDCYTYDDTFLCAKPVNIPVIATSGKFYNSLVCKNYLGIEDIYYQFRSDDNEVWWLLTAEEIGHIPNTEDKYILYYTDGGMGKDSRVFKF